MSFFLSNALRIFLLFSTVMAVMSQANFSVPYVKYMKLIFCDECNDASIKADLAKFMKCSSDLFPAHHDELLNIRAKHIANPDKCVADVIALWQALFAEKVDARDLNDECFFQQVIQDQIVRKCYSGAG